MSNVNINDTANGGGGSGGSSSGSSGSSGGGSSSSGGSSGSTAQVAVQAETAVSEIQGALSSSLILIGVLIVIFGIGLAWTYFKRSTREKRDTNFYSARADYYKQLNRYWERKNRD